MENAAMRTKLFIMAVVHYPVRLNEYQLTYYNYVCRYHGRQLHHKHNRYWIS